MAIYSKRAFFMPLSSLHLEVNSHLRPFEIQYVFYFRKSTLILSIVWMKL